MIWRVDWWYRTWELPWLKCSYLRSFSSDPCQEESSEWRAQKKLAKTRGKLRSLQSSIAFLKTVISQRVVPKWIYARIDKSRARLRPNMESAFMRDEIEKKRSLIKMQKSHYRTLRSHVRTILSFFDLLRFCRYVAKVDNVKEKKICRKTNATFVYFDCNDLATQLTQTTKTSLTFPITNFHQQKNSCFRTDSTSAFHLLYQLEERRNFCRVRSTHCSTSAPSTSITRKALRFESQTERFGARLLRHACWCRRFSHAQGMSQCYQIPAIKQQYSDYQTRQSIRLGDFEQNRLHQKDELHSWRRNEIFDTRPIKWKGQHFKDRIPDTTQPAAVAQRRFAPCKFIWFSSTDWLSTAAHVRPSQNTQKRCATPTHSVYDRFSATPASQISLFSSRTCSHSLFEQLHTGLFHFRWHH